MVGSVIVAQCRVHPVSTIRLVGGPVVILDICSVDFISLLLTFKISVTGSPRLQGLVPLILPLFSLSLSLPFQLRGFQM